jgi:hypothetical protein
MKERRVEIHHQQREKVEKPSPSPSPSMGMERELEMKMVVTGNLRLKMLKVQGLLAKAVVKKLPRGR